MYAQVAIKPNPLLRNGAYGIVMRGVQKCTRGCSSLRGCTSQQKLDTNFKYYLSINLISVQYGASFATFLSG